MFGWKWLASFCYVPSIVRVLAVVFVYASGGCCRFIIYYKVWPFSAHFALLSVWQELSSYATPRSIVLFRERNMPKICWHVPIFFSLFFFFYYLEKLEVQSGFLSFSILWNRRQFLKNPVPFKMIWLSSSSLPLNIWKQSGFPCASSSREN